jgi:hypothetical protein
MRFSSISLKWGEEFGGKRLSFKQQEEDARLLSPYMSADIPANTSMVRHSVELYSEKSIYMIQYSFIISTNWLRLEDNYKYLLIRILSEINLDFSSIEERTKPADRQTWKYGDVCDNLNISTSNPFKIAVETTFCGQLYLNNSLQFLL